MAAPIRVETAGPASNGRVPPLENGDRLSRAEFEQRYEAMPELKKAELLEGVVYVPSPVRVRKHGGPHFQLITWLGTYQAATPGVEGADNSTVRLDLDNEPQPDAVLYVDPRRGGQARISADDYIVGAPELVAEVAASSVSYDLDVKLRVYRRNGVREYLVWRVLDRQVDWFVLREGRFEPLAPNESGCSCSTVFGGLWLDVDALLGGNLARVLAVAKQGIASSEHAEFLKNLPPPPPAPADQPLLGDSSSGP